jgi:hypothetical protein
MKLIINDMIKDEYTTQNADKIVICTTLRISTSVKATLLTSTRSSVLWRRTVLQTVAEVSEESEDGDDTFGPQH